MKADKVVITVSMLAILAVLIVGLVKVYQAVNEPQAKSADITLPKVDQGTLDSARSRSDAGHFNTDQEVSNTRANPFEHYSGYVAPNTPSTPSAPTTDATTPPTDTSTSSSTSTSTTTSAGSTTSSSTAPTTGSTTSSTAAATESDGGKQLPTLPTDLQKAGF